MKLLDAQLEFTALRTICNARQSDDKGEHTQKAGAVLIASLKEGHFYDKTAKEVFNLIKKITKEEGEIPSWNDLMIDRSLPSSIRKELKAYRKLKPNTAKESKKTVKTLEELRKGRMLLDISDKIQRTLSDETPNIDKLFSKTIDTLSNNQHATSNTEDITVLGNKKSSKSLVDFLINDPKDAVVIPTGFAAFDSENGGFFKSGLATIAANSGGGKSVMLTQLSKNMAERGYKVCVVPLEMTKHEMGARFMSNISEIDVRKFTGAQKLTQGEKDKARKAYTRWEKDLDKCGGSIRIFCPEEDMTIEELLNFLSIYGDDVIAIDYIGLLGGVDGDDQWQRLGQVARYAKRWSTLNDKRVILFAQLSDEGQIRYSKAIKDHSDVMWCVPGDTYISTPTGLLRMDELAPSLDTQLDISIPIMSQGKATHSVNFLNQGVKPVYEVYTDTGSMVRCTLNEKFKVVLPNLTYDWKELSELRKGDILVKSRTQARFGLNEGEIPKAPECIRFQVGCSIRIFYNLCSYLLSNKTTISNTGITFDSNDPEDLRHFRDAYNMVFKDGTIIETSVRCTILQEDVASYLTSLDGIKDKCIPNFIMNSGRTLISFFLSVYFKQIGFDGTNTIISRSPKLIQQLRLLLNVLFIYPNYDKSTNHGEKFTLKIIKSEQERFKRAMNGNLDRADPPVLIGKCTRKEETDESLLFLLKAERMGYYFERYSHHVYSGDEVVYDLSIPDTHEYVANGFSIHNCWTFTEKNREAKEIYIVQQKARNQKQFDFPLGIDYSIMKIHDVDEVKYTPKKKDKIDKFKRKVKKGMKEEDSGIKKKKRKVI